MGRRGPQPSTSPTARQREVLAFISGYIDRAGYPPTLREIGDALGIASTNGVTDHLKALERYGLIRRDRHNSRGLVIMGRTPAAAPVPTPSPSRCPACGSTNTVKIDEGTRGCKGCGEEFTPASAAADAETDDLRAAILAEVRRLEALGPETVAQMERHERAFGAKAKSSLLVLRRLGGAG